MELLLNLVWLFVAALAIGAWCKRWRGDGSKPQRQTSRGWIALACALVLLFFVISLTDDLHAEVMVVEDASASKRHSCSVVSHSIHAPSQSSASHHAVAVLPPSGFLLRKFFQEKVTPEAPRATVSALPFAPGRSPPSPSH